MATKTKGITKADLAEQEQIKDRIRRWAKLGEQRRWGLGDEYNRWLKIDVAEDAEVKEGRLSSLTLFIETELKDEDITVAMLKTYGLVCKVWREHERVEGVSYSVHRELISPENRELIRPGMTIATAVEAKVAHQRARLKQRLEGEILPKRTPDDPYAEGNEDRESNIIPVEAGPKEADVRYERTRLRVKFDEATENLHEIADNLQGVLGVIIREDKTTGAWPHESVLEGKVGWLRRLDNMERYIATIRALIENPKSMDEGLAEILGGE